MTDSLDDARRRRLLSLGLADEGAARSDRAEEAPLVGSCLGEYLLVAVLGRGGMGVVFDAHSTAINQRVALKALLGGPRATTVEIRRFLREAESAANLRHDNIVRVLHVGEQDGWPFFTMPVMEGKNLALYMRERATERELHPRRWARLATKVMRPVVDAVHHAHTHGLLHRDLKPENILLDEAGNPSIADFGLAIALDRQGNASEGSAVVGTAAYMSPEQADGGSKGLDFRSDVYSLGAVFYEFLTGAVPFSAPSEEEILARIRGPEPATPVRILSPEVPRALEAICMKCLEKVPERRYETAAQLADDLDSVLAGRPPSIAPMSTLGRAVHWMRRNPERTATLSKYVLGVVAAIALLLGGWQSARREERAILDTNAFIATSQAGAALFQLREYADRVQQAATEPAIISLVRADPKTPAPDLQKLADGLDTVFVLATSAYVRAQYPVPPADIFERRFEFRDYFACARSLGERGTPGVCVARAFRSERDDQLKFGVAAPLFEDGAWSGVLVAVVAADSVFGKVRMTSPERGHVTALLGPRDVERDGRREGSQDRFVFVVHDGLTRGQEVLAPNRTALRAAFQEAHPVGQQFSLAYAPPRLDPDYEDPVRGFENRWLAAFAPVGGTGYVIVVQSPRVGLLRSLGDLRRFL